MKYPFAATFSLICFQAFAQVGTPPSQRPERVASMPRLNLAPLALDEVVGLHLDGPVEAPVVSLRILIVDDEDNVVLSPRRHLSRGLCHNVTIARGGAQAVALVGEQEFDLILMDHHMPEMNGLETTRLLREMHVQTPIVSHSTNTFEDATRGQYEELGVVHFFNKGQPSKAAYEKLISDIFVGRVI